MTAISRRTALAGVATLAVPGAAAAVCIPAGFEGPDPIFAFIDKHKAAYIRQMEATNVCSNTVDAKWSPEYDEDAVTAAEAARVAAAVADDAAAAALYQTTPTTIAGVIALIAYIEQFNAGAITLPDDPDWHSAPMFWPTTRDEIDLFGYEVLSNIKRALMAMTVQS